MSRRLRVPSTRSDLLSLLSEACELEHGLTCSYLYSAFTLKQDLSEGNITWKQVQLVRKWAAQIYFVASEEMLHLGQAWNLLSAIGGTPYYLRPNFPQNAKYYPIQANLSLEPFGLHAMRRFVFYERPQTLPAEEACGTDLGIPQTEMSNPTYTSVGELYSLIRRGFETIASDALFIGNPDLQVGRDLVDFPDVISVVDRESAFAAIDMIIEQGEGNPADPVNSHYGAFIEVLKEYEDEMAAVAEEPAVFEPARLAVINPIARARGDYGNDPLCVTTRLTDPYACAVSELFDEIYMLLLRMLQYVFSNPTASRAQVEWFAHVAVVGMPVVVKPLGEALTLLPAGESGHGERAGPSFAMSRHVPLPSDSRYRETYRNRATRRVEEGRRQSRRGRGRSEDAHRGCLESLGALSLVPTN